MAFNAGAIDRMGRVDEGNTLSDFERLSNAVASPFTRLSRTPNGIVVTPVKNGQPLTSDIFNHAKKNEE